MAKLDLKNASLQVNETFSKSQRVFIDKYINTLIETESFFNYSKYTREIVIDNFRAFASYLVSEIWQNFAGSSNVEVFFNILAPKITKLLSSINNELLTKNIVSDSMSEKQARTLLEEFFNEVYNRKEFDKAQTEYLKIKQELNDISQLVEGLYVSGSEIIESSSFLLEHYLKYKAAILKGMGYDVVLEYVDMQHFDLIYRDSRLESKKQRMEVENIVMNGALKALMPGFNGDISVFYRTCEQLIKSE